jgi:hypothetical protein
MTQETPLASVFSKGHFVGTILSRGPKGYEAIGEDNTSHGCFPSQKEAAAALQMAARSTHPQHPPQHPQGAP